MLCVVVVSCLGSLHDLISTWWGAWFTHPTKGACAHMVAVSTAVVWRFVLAQICTPSNIRVCVNESRYILYN